MKCLYCGKRILAFRLFSGGETFCSEEHGNLYRKNEAESAIQRILTLDPPKKARLTPAPVVAVIPTITEAEPPPMTGFRLPVLAVHNYAGGAAIGPLPISLEILTPASVRPSPAQPLTAYLNLIRPAALSAPASATTLLPATEHQRVPAPPEPGFALGGATGPQRLSWVPRADSLLRMGEALMLRASGRGQPTPLAPAPQLTLPPALAHLGWPALADGQAGADAADCGLAAEPAIAMPWVPLERFTSSWIPGRTLALWTSGRADAAFGLPTFAEVSSALPDSLRLPAVRSDRDARPSAATFTSLWRIARDSQQSALEQAATARPVQLPSLGELAGAGRALRGTRFAALPLVACRPFPANPRVMPEPAMEPSIWNAWPETPRSQAAPACNTGMIANGHTWRPLAATSSRPAGRSAASSVRLLDAPERCRTVTLTLPVETSALRASALPPTPRWPLEVAVPAAHVRPLAMTILPRETVRPPVQTVPATHQPLASAPTWSVAPAAQTPPLEAVPPPALCREELALRFVSHWPEAGASVPRPLATAPLWPEQLAVQPPLAETEATPALVERSERTLRHPATGSALTAALTSVRRPVEVWGQVNDGRPLDATLAQQRDVPLRLCIEEIPVTLTLGLVAPEVRPVTSTWTPLALQPAPVSREFVAAAPVPTQRALCAPDLEITSRSTNVARARFTPAAWTSLRAAPEPVVRRRQLPASRPKMNLPRPRPLQGSIALPGLTQLGAILAAERQVAHGVALELIPPGS